MEKSENTLKKELRKAKLECIAFKLILVEFHNVIDVS